MNRLDKIARRSKRVGGAIADLWGGQYLCFGRELYGEKLSWTEKSIDISRVPYCSEAVLSTASDAYVRAVEWEPDTAPT